MTDTQIQLNADSVISDHIKNIINSDSIQILEYNKLHNEDEPIDERMVYIDYRTNSNQKDGLRTFNKHFEKVLNNNSYIFVKEPINGKVVNNPYREIDGTTISIRQLRDKYVLFNPDIEYKVIITDTAIFFRDMEGWFLNKYKSVAKDNNRYVIDFYNYKYYTQRIEIKFLDEKGTIQLWKMTRIDDNEESYFYGLNIPIKESIKYPILDILNTGGLDDVYENFDDIDFEELYIK